MSAITFMLIVQSFRLGKNFREQAALLLKEVSVYTQVHYAFDMSVAD